MLIHYLTIIIHICISANLYIHEYSLILMFLQKSIKKSGNIAVLDLFVFYIQNILGNLVSHFLLARRSMLTQNGTGLAIHVWGMELG